MVEPSPHHMRGEGKRGMDGKAQRAVETLDGGRVTEARGDLATWLGVRSAAGMEKIGILFNTDRLFNRLMYKIPIFLLTNGRFFCAESLLEPLRLSRARFSVPWPTPSAAYPPIRGLRPLAGVACARHQGGGHSGGGDGCEAGWRHLQGAQCQRQRLAAASGCLFRAFSVARQEWE